MFGKHHYTFRMSKQIQHVTIITEITLNQRNIERLSGFKPLVTVLFRGESINEI